MNPRDPNVAIVETVARSLGTLIDRVVFVGGCAVGLLITDSGRPAVRATKDVDVFVEMTTRRHYYDFGEELRSRGFKEAKSDEVICRWVLGALQVDVMPTDKSVLGFANKWSLPAVKTARQTKLPSGTAIQLIAPQMLLATKIEAFFDRGEGNFGNSHDIEDIVNLVDGREEIVRDVSESDSELQTYLAHEVDDFLGNPAFLDALPFHLGPNVVEQERIGLVIERLRKIAKL